MAFETVEDFFLNRIDTGRVFEFLERSEYLFLYNIQKCREDSGEEKVYLSDLAEAMHFTVIETSRFVKSLEDKGFVSWKTDENKEHTYVQLTGKAKDLLRLQNEKMEKAYDRITAEIPEDEMRQMISTLEKIRGIMTEREP